MSTQKETLNVGKEVVAFMKNLHLSAKGEAVALSRCDTLTEVKMTAAFWALHQKLENVGFEVRSEDNLALCAGVLGQFRIDSEDNLRSGDKPFSEALSAGASSGNPVFKMRRFQRLIQKDNPEDLYNPMRRVIRHVGQDICPFRLAKDLLYFGEGIREKWAKGYHKAVLPNLSF